ncbi:MAG: aminotransferase class IV [Rhodothermales bacterium]
MRISTDILRDNPDFQLIETMLFRHRIRFLEDHLARMRLSARVFEIPFNERAIRGEVADVLRSLDMDASYKIRLTLNVIGKVSCEKTRISAEINTKSNAVKRLCISPVAVNSENLFFYHKTTRRELYESEYTRAQSAGFYEILFLNQHGTVTEASRNNVLIKVGDTIYTPPLRCGLLGGVYRKQLLQRCGNIIEAELSLSDLKQASSIYLTNAVRGLRKINGPLELPELSREDM